MIKLEEYKKNNKYVIYCDELKLATIEKEDNILYIACISGGKDSTAMLISIKKYNLPLDYILFADTGAEFDEVYKTIGDIDIWAKENLGIGITKIRAKYDFIYYLTKYKRKRGKFVGKPYIFLHQDSVGAHGF